MPIQPSEQQSNIKKLQDLLPKLNALPWRLKARREKLTLHVKDLNKEQLDFIVNLEDELGFRLSRRTSKHERALDIPYNHNLERDDAEIELLPPLEKSPKLQTLWDGLFESARKRLYEDLEALASLPWVYESESSHKDNLRSITFKLSVLDIPEDMRNLVRRNCEDALETSCLSFHGRNPIRVSNSYRQDNRFYILLNNKGLTPNIVL